MPSVEEDLERSPTNSQQVIVESNASSSSCYIPRRYVMAFVCFFGLMIIYAMRIILVIAIVSMSSTPDDTSSTSASKDDVCPPQGQRTSSNTTSAQTGTYNWDAQTQAIVISASMYGTLLGQLPGGCLAVRFGGKIVLVGSAALLSVFTLVSPVAAEANVILLIVCRVGAGFACSGVQPAIHALLAKWIPPAERTRISALVYTGMNLGNIVGSILTGLFCGMDFLGGWPAAFYVYGLAGIVWTVLAIFTVYESPAVHPRISSAEKTLIIESTSKSVRKNLPPIPWKAIAKSPPVWAIVAATFGTSWSIFALIQEIPTYFSEMYSVSTTITGYIATIGYIASWVFSVFFGFLAGFIRSKDYLSPTGTRKLMQVIALGAYMAECLCMAYAVNCNYAAAIAVYALGQGLNGAQFAAFYTNHIDLSPNYAAALWGSCTLLGTTAAIIAPLVGGAILNSGSSLSTNWVTVYDINAGVCLATTVIYLLFASAEEQSWNKPNGIDKMAAEDEISTPDVPRRISILEL